MGDLPVSSSTSASTKNVLLYQPKPGVVATSTAAKVISTTAVM